MRAPADDACCLGSLQVAFKSEWLSLAGAATSAMSELLWAKEALADVSRALRQRIACCW